MEYAGIVGVYYHSERNLWVFIQSQKPLVILINGQEIYTYLILVCTTIGGYFCLGELIKNL